MSILGKVTRPTTGAKIAEYAAAGHAGASPSDAYRIFGTRPDWGFFVHGASWGLVLDSVRRLATADTSPLDPVHQCCVASAIAMVLFAW